MEDTEALEIWRPSVMLLFYYVINCPTLKRPHIDFTTHTEVHTHVGMYNYSNIFAKGMRLSLHTTDACRHGDTNS